MAVIIIQQDTGTALEIFGGLLSRERIWPKLTENIICQASFPGPSQLAVQLCRRGLASFQGLSQLAVQLCRRGLASFPGPSQLAVQERASLIPRPLSTCSTVMRRRGLASFPGLHPDFIWQPWRRIGNHMMFVTLYDTVN